MTEQSNKSTLHDATPSWNGFNYQGKVGLYVSLHMINERLQKDGLGVRSTTAFLNDHSLEYEWIEDFSIKSKNDYISLHQVKHYNDSKFSSYKDAIDTIVSRTIGTISKTDIQNYLSAFKYKNIKKRSELILKELISKKILTSKLYLEPDWAAKILTLPAQYQPLIEKCLYDYSSLRSTAYSNKTPNYIHSCNTISPPSPSLNDYVWSSEKIKSTLNGKELKDFNIHISQAPNFKFLLAQNDTDLDQSIMDLIKKIKALISPSSTPLLNEDCYTCYRSALLLELQTHIQQRHQSINTHNASCGKFSLAVDSIPFTKFLNILEKDIKIQDTLYFELLSKCFLEDTLNLYELKIQNALDDYTDEPSQALPLRKKLSSLQHYRTNIISRLTISELHIKLQQCSPHYTKKAPLDIYYNKILSLTNFENVFLKFILQLIPAINEFHPACSQKYRYLPSLIDIEKSIGKPEKNHNRLSLDITNACALDSFTDSLIYNYHYITINTKQGESVNTPIQPPTIGEDFEDPTASTAPSFTSKLPTRLISIEDALIKINGDPC